MTRRFSLLGAQGNLEAVGEHLTREWGIEFRRHESGFRGGDYLRGEGPTVQEAIVQANFEDEEGYLAEEAYAEFPVLIYLTQAVDAPGPESLSTENVRILRVEEL